MAYPIQAESYGGLSSLLANQDAMRQRALEVGFANMMRGFEMNARRKEAAAMEQYRDRVSNENVRQFNESMNFSREAPVGRAVTPTEAVRLSENGVSFNDEEWDEMLAPLTKSGRLSLDDARTASLNRRNMREGIATEAERQDKFARELNNLPALRSLRDQQRKIAGENPRLSNSLLYNLIHRMGGKSPLSLKDFEPGLEAGDRRLSERAFRLEPEKKLLQQDVKGRWERTVEYPRGMETTNQVRRLPSAAPVDRVVPQSVRTNAPVRMLDKDNRVWLVAPENVPLAESRGAIVIR